MTVTDAKKLRIGVYRLFWSGDSGGGMSLVSIGRDREGFPWYAPVNWVNVPGKDWTVVDRAELIEATA